MMDAAVVAYAGVAATFAAAGAAALAGAARAAARRPGSRAYDRSHAPFRHGRLAVMGVVTALQATLAAWRCAAHWEETGGPGWLDGGQFAAVLLDAAVLAVLLWPPRHQQQQQQQWGGGSGMIDAGGGGHRGARATLALQLSSTLLAAMGAVGALLLADVTLVRPGASFDVEHVARIVAHGSQLVLLLGLLISEVVVQQHRLLLRGILAADQADELLAGTSGTGGSGSGQRLANGGGSDGYAPLPGDNTPEAEAARKHSLLLVGGGGDEEDDEDDGGGADEDDDEEGVVVVGGGGGGGGGDGGGRAAPQPRRRRRRRRRQPQRPWQPGDGRWAMAGWALRYVWPTSRALRVRLGVCFALVLVERAVNLALPIAYKRMVEALSDAASAAAAAAAAAAASADAGAAGPGGDAAAAGAGAGGGAGDQGPVAAAARALLASLLGGAGGGDSAAPAATAAAVGALFWALFYPWAFVFLASFLLRGGSGSEGLLANLRDILYVPISQAAFRRISNAVFRHLLALDLNWHLHRKTGAVMRILDRGTSSIQDTASTLLFNVGPEVLDVALACGYLAARMLPWAAVVVLLTVASYVPLTLVITERRGRVRKEMNALDNEREGRATDMLLNVETVKIFGAERLELAGFDRATRRYQGAEYWQLCFLSLLSLVQSLVVWVGLAAGVVVCVAGVARGAATVGDAVLFVALMQQLCAPLTSFGSYYRQTQKALIDMQSMFELLATPPAVMDERGAPPLAVARGAVEFRDVVFHYPGLAAAAPVLRGVSFRVAGGETVAVVGSTGSGKSTLLRLLLRFYDVQRGAVLIDGQDVRRVSQASLRAAIGVVPQDCVLFNDTVLYNIRYGRPAASDAQVVEAARVSHIHEHLARMPRGYDTRVGERGLRLSGGEKQRVAFARAVLKAPAIMVLDEATSSLDTLTERLIQDSLAAIRGRCTQLIVAHRLSTVQAADAIVVLERGRVAEHGSHAALVAAGGLYARMWARQQAPAAAADGAAAGAGPQGGAASAAGGPAGGGGGSSSGGGAGLLTSERSLPELRPPASGRVSAVSGADDSDPDDDDDDDDGGGDDDGGVAGGTGAARLQQQQRHQQQQQRQNEDDHDDGSDGGEVQPLLTSGSAAGGGGGGGRRQQGRG